MKNNFLKVLRSELTLLKYDEQEQIIQEYLSIFEIKEEEGLSQEEIIMELGDPKDIARQFIDEFNGGKQQQFKTYDNNNSKRNITLFIVMLVFHALIGIWLIISAWLLVLSLYLMSFALTFAPIISFMFNGAQLSLATFAMTFMMIGAGLLMLSLSNVVAKFGYRLTKSHLKWLRSLLG